nr:NAD-dependent epimerase/dehydratase family protein [uncultured Desulfobacter sp.]
MKKKLLITGGAGFIGSNLIHALDKTTWDIVVLDALIKQVHPTGKWHPPEHISFIHGKIQDRDAVEAAIDGVEYIVHLAAETGVGQSAYEIARYVETNEYGTALLLEIAAKHLKRLKGIVLASSRAVYGEGRYICPKCQDVFPGPRNKSRLEAGHWGHACPLCHGEIQPAGSVENQPLKPGSCYAITKQNQEQLVELFSETYNIPAVSLRFQNVYGPGQSLSNPYTGILSIFSTRILAGNPVMIYEDGNETRDFVFVDDVVRSICLPLEKGFSGYDVFNVGTGIGTSVYDIAQTLNKALDANIGISIVHKYRIGDIRHAWADMGKIKALYEFSSKIPIHEGLKRFGIWVKSQPRQEDGYKKMEHEMEARGLMGRFSSMKEKR